MRGCGNRTRDLSDRARDLTALTAELSPALDLAGISAPGLFDRLLELHGPEPLLVLGTEAGALFR